MSDTLCGAECSLCPFREKCPGCLSTDGRPFGGECLAAECIKCGGMAGYAEYQKELIGEINSLQISGMPHVEQLFALNGSFVNLAYPLPGGHCVQFLDDRQIYLGTQLESKSGDDSGGSRCFGVIAGRDFIIVSSYVEQGRDPQLVMYKARKVKLCDEQ